MDFQMWWIWAFLAAVFIAGEFLLNGSVLLWLGFGSAVSCILALLKTPTAGQAAVFFNLSFILILLERRFKERYRLKTWDELSENKEGLSNYNREHYVFQTKGPVWEIVFNGTSYTIKHSKGLSHIKNLIISQGKWITCTDLKNISSRILDNETDQYKDMSKNQLDLENLTAYENLLPEDIIDRLSMEQIKKLRELLKEKIDINDFSDPEELIQSKNTLDFIEDYLKKNTNILGKSRKMPDRAETDRKAVSAAINRCRKSLKEHKELYTHFKSFIQAKGNSFRYLPDRPIHWKTD
ncbi:NfeD family protein [Thermodesulfobacteriota bacterium]